MGVTKKTIKSEVKTMYKGILEDLTSQERLLAQNEKVELRRFMYETFQDAKIHAFASVFIKRKIKDIIKARTEEPSHYDLSDIVNVCDDDCDCHDDQDNQFEKSQLKDLAFLVEHIGVEEAIVYIMEKYKLTPKDVNKIFER